MIANHRKKALQELHKQALINKIAQEASNINNTIDSEAYAKNVLKQMLEATEIDLPIDFD